MQAVRKQKAILLLFLCPTFYSFSQSELTAVFHTIFTLCSYRDITQTTLTMQTAQFIELLIAKESNTSPYCSLLLRKKLKLNSVF